MSPMPSLFAPLRSLPFAALSCGLAAVLGLGAFQATVTSCDDGSAPGLCNGVVVDASVPGPDAGTSCEFPCPVTSPSLGAGGDTYAGFAAPFFETYCSRCHESARDTNCFITSDPTCRNGAPSNHDWDQPSDIRRHLAHIREVMAVGPEVPLTMPPDLPVTPDAARPAPSCEERYRLVRWIDADAPGLP